MWFRKSGRNELGFLEFDINFRWILVHYSEEFNIYLFESKSSVAIDNKRKEWNSYKTARKSNWVFKVLQSCIQKLITAIALSSWSVVTQRRCQHKFKSLSSCGMFWMYWVMIVFLQYIDMAYHQRKNTQYKKPEIVH